MSNDFFKFREPKKGEEPLVVRLLPPLFNPVSLHHRHQVPGQCPICNHKKEQNKMSKHALEPCLIPESAWGQSLCNLHKQDRCKYWPGLRDEAFIKNNTECMFCENKAVHGHEVWKYDDREAVLTLDDVVPICEMCHHVVHLGRSEVLAAQGQLDFKAVLAHFAKVRDCKMMEAEAIARAAFDTWEVRSRRKWRVCYGKYEMFIHPPGGLPDISVFDDMPVIKDMDRLPSTTHHVKWLSVRRNPQKMCDKNKYGVFLLSGTMAEMDRLWPLVAKMTMEGVLASEAYASTAAARETAGIYRDTGVIGIVLGDRDDKDDMEMILTSRFGRFAKLTFKRQ